MPTPAVPPPDPRVPPAPPVGIAPVPSRTVPTAAQIKPKRAPPAMPHRVRGAPAFGQNRTPLKAPPPSSALGPPFILAQISPPEAPPPPKGASVAGLFPSAP